MENLVFFKLKREDRDVYYYKTKSNKEVDFLTIKSGGKELTQVSQSIKNKITKDREVGGLIEALQETGLKKGVILTEDEEDLLNIEKKQIIVKPIYKWLLQ